MQISEMLKAIADTGMSQAKIAEAIGVSQPTVYRAMNGGPMRYEPGKQVEALYAQVIQDQSGSVSQEAA
ncbi:MAG: helix-turn-helix domain-containing protein [Pseudomonas sp.]|nr:helix-turn-helix domain-containing protein [Pseudomonas sp.]